MRLPEIFGLSTFPVFWTFQTFGLRNKSGVIPLFLNVQNFLETYRKSYWKTKIYQKMLKMLKMLKIYRNFQKSTVYVKSWRYIFDILVICLKKCSNRRPQKAWKWPKFDQKYQKLYRIVWNVLTVNTFLAFRYMSKVYRKIRLFIFTKVGTFSEKCTEVQNCYQNPWPYRWPLIPHLLLTIKGK